MTEDPLVSRCATAIQLHQLLMLLLLLLML
jgi:hypothetical protein